MKMLSARMTGSSLRGAGHVLVESAKTMVGTGATDGGVGKEGGTNGLGPVGWGAVQAPGKV